jgi:hypothetical protein
MGSVVDHVKLEERRRERQRAKIIAALEQQANASLVRRRDRPRYSLREIVLVLITIAVSAGVLVAGKMVADSAVEQTSLHVN